MGIETFPRYQSSFVDHKRTAWDPCATLKIVNPDVGHPTCVGYAPSQRRRCRNPIAAGARACVYKMLEVLASTPPDSSSIESQLEQIAALSLCRRNHQNQVDSIVDQWLYRISLMERPLRRQRSSQLNDEDPDTSHARSKATRNSNWQDPSSASTASEEFSRTSNPKRESYRQDTAAPEQGQERAHVKQKRRETGRAEQERRDREQEACAEREFQDEKLRQQSAQRKHEERQKQAQMKAEEERKSWDQAWEAYVKGWTVFKGAQSSRSTFSSVPLPVTLLTGSSF